MRLKLIVILFLIVTGLRSQGFKSKDWPGATNATKAIFEVSPGNYIAGGFTRTGGAFNKLCIMGIGNQGQLLWTKNYGVNVGFTYSSAPFFWDRLESRYFYKHGNALFYSGRVRDTSIVQDMGALVKFNMNGDTLWQKIYKDSNENVVPLMMTVSVDGGYLMTGYFDGGSYRKCLLIKTDASGNELWRKKIVKDTTNFCEGRGIVQDTASKKIVIVGDQYIGSLLCDDVLILDSLGNLLDQHSYTGGYGGGLIDVIQTSDKKIVAVGNKQYYNQYYGMSSGEPFLLEKSFAVKFDINLLSQPLWTLNGFDKLASSGAIAHGNSFTCLTEMQNGDIAIGGVIDTLSIYNTHYYTLNNVYSLYEQNDITRITKVNTNGNILWNGYYDYYPGPQFEMNELQIRSLNRTSDGSLVGAIEYFNSPYSNPMFFAKWDSTGCDSSIIYCQMMTAGIGKNYLQENNIMISPNPSSDIVTVSILNLAPEKNAIITITDITGQEVKRVFWEAENKQELHLEDLSNGIYIINLTKDQIPLYHGKLVKQD